MENPIYLRVFIHSHYETGEPIEVDVLEICGHIQMDWFRRVFDNNDRYYQTEIAIQFHEVLGKCEDHAWFKCYPRIEFVHDEGLEAFVEIEKIELPPKICVACPECYGAGRVYATVGTAHISNARCDRCHGEGKIAG